MSSIKKGLRRAGVGGLSAVLATTAMTGFASMASANATFAFDRVAGANRYATSVATAKVFGDSANVILASGVKGHFPDALAASYLAGRKSAPVMLTTLNTTPPEIAAQIAARGTKNIWIVGGTGVVSAAQEAALATKYTVHRLGGSDRYVTAGLVIADGGTAASTTAVLATGQDFPDALGGGALSYAKVIPLAITKTNTLPGETLAALKVAGTKSVTILGGPDVVSANVVTMLTAAGITSTRIFGADRAETSSKLADFEITSHGFTNTAVNVASGYRAGDGVDALGGAAVSGKELRPLLITDNQNLVGPGVEAFLKAHAPTLATGHIFGGFGAVSAAAEAIMTADARTGAAAGQISFASTTVAQGGTLAGTLANAAAVKNVAVTGCGINNANVAIAGDGTFSLLTPASQAAGACNLVFTITNTDGTTSTQTVPITVTGTPRGVTAAPDLLSASIVTGTNNVLYTFDAPLATVGGVTSFHVYSANGKEINPQQITSSGSTVTARYLAGDLVFATTATVDAAAVTDANGRPNPVNAAPLQSVTLDSGVTDAPDLATVGNPGTVLVGSVGVPTFDFTFDSPVSTPVAGGSGAGFSVVSTDGVQFFGGTVTSVSVDRKTLTVSFASLSAAAVPVTQVVRGVVASGAVSNGVTNPLEVAKVGLAQSTAPDLTSVTVVGTDTVRFTFDQPISCTSAAGFQVYNATGAEATGTLCTVVSGNSASADVKFISGKVADAVGASVRSGAVTATTGSPLQVNAPDELGLQSITFQAGRTTLPDLVSVTKSTDAFGVTKVIYTFDDAFLALPAASNFFLYDATGAQYTATGGAALSNGNKSVTVTSGFTAAQLTAAIIGGVDANPGPDPALSTPAFPEGAANVV